MTQEKAVFRSILFASAALLLLGLTTTNVGKPANAQTPPPDDEKGVYRFMAVQKWEGSFSWEGSGAGRMSVPNGDLSWQSTHAANGKFTMEGPAFPYEGQNVAVWTGPLEGTGNINTEITIKHGCTTDFDRWTSSGPIPGVLGPGEPNYVPRPARAELEIDLDTGIYHVAISPETVDTSNYHRSVCRDFVSENTSEYTTALGADGFSNGHVFVDLPDSGLFLDGSVEFVEQIPQMWGISDVGGEVPWSYNWAIHPTGKADVEMVVSPQNFATWLPEGGTANAVGSIGVGASRPVLGASSGVEVEYSGGNTLTVTAKLQGVDGAPPKQKARKFTFDLMNVSNEPGIAMNAPSVTAKQDLPDLEFGQLENLPLKVRVLDPNKAETTTEGITEATAIIKANDWGAWGLLKVTAELESGQQIVGYLEGDKDQKEIRIPKRKPDSKVAEYWKNLYAASGRADDDDAEVSPVGLEGCYGDGLTLYEEYRGFFENRKHIRTRPDRRDYFTTDRIGTAYSRAGIAMFKQATQLEVHGEMRLDELGPNLVVNFNHRAAPHAVDQHGTQIMAGPSPGMPGVSVKRLGYKGLGTPGTFAYVLIDTGLNPQVSPEKARRYATIVAHELAHTVGVSEHGAGDKQVQWTVWEEPNGEMWVHELDTEPGSTKPPIKIIVKTEDGAVIPPTSEIFSKIEGAYVTIGVRRGQHSGVEACLMRYDESWAYASTTEKNVRYYVKGDEHRDALLCSTYLGTGVNDQAHEPQSRYGPAGPNRGDCLHQVCVNDLIDVPQR